MPGEAGVCTELHRTEGHSEGVGTGAELRANRAPRTRLRGGARSRPRVDPDWLRHHGGGQGCDASQPRSISKWPRDQGRRTFSQQSQ